jgi:hypothetical protein
MKGNVERLIDAAYEAAEVLLDSKEFDQPALVIAVSCVGRKLLLKQRTEEELEAIMELMPEKVHQIGFYAYGEISMQESGQCDLHNQTMTLSLIMEE